MLSRPSVFVAVALAIGGALLAPAGAVGNVGIPSVIATPGVSGDQLLFFFDARTDRVPFLTISNLAGAAVTLEVVYYSQDLSRELAVEKRTIEALGNIVIDPTGVSGVGGNAGIATVTPVGGSPERAVVPPSATASFPTPPLFGSFTLANTKLGAGFGQNPLARLALASDGTRPAPGTVVDGYRVRYQRLAPDALIVPTYFRPSDLAPASQDGNRIILVTFRDRYGQSFRIGPTHVEFDALFADADGKAVASKSNLGVSGVHLDTFQNLASPVGLQTSGKISFVTRTTLEGDANAFGLVAQALGTFSIGQRMPGIFQSDPFAPKTVFVTPDFLPNGAIGGLAAADGICQQWAEQAGLDGTYRAWLSDATDSPDTRFTRSVGPYVLPNGTKVADDWYDLTDGALDAPIDVTAFGGKSTLPSVFTNTAVDGRSYSQIAHCRGWTVSFNVESGFVGRVGATTTDWTVDEPVACHHNGMGLYCFEQ